MDRQWIDCRGDCCRGYKDARLRLGMIRSGETYGCLVDAPVVGRLERVILINDGRIRSREDTPDGIRLIVEKT